MITVEKLEKGTYFDDAFKISFRYDPTTVAKVKQLAERRYLPEDRAWEIPAHELPALIEKVGLSTTTSNLSPEELRGELGDRIASRVLGSSQVVEITSGDRRGL